MWFIVVSSVALAADWSSLLADDGWEPVTTSDTKVTGSIVIETKTIDDMPCLRGTATVDAAVDTLYEVVTDVPSAKQWSSETLIASKVLGQDGDQIDYYQHLDVPNWTMASDRYWVLRGRPDHQGDTKAFRWERFDWKSVYPDLATELDDSGAVEPSPNYGSWRFTPKDGQTEARYYLCSNPGGSLPGWLQKAAATKTLPNTMADVVREAKKRG